MLSAFLVVSLLARIGLACDTSEAPRPIIIDTDIFSDVDDVGALAVANALHNCGLADLRGVAINTHSQYGALAASAVNTYFGNGDVPIAALRPLTNETFVDNYFHKFGEYASRVAGKFPRALDDSSTTPTPVELYRAVLSTAANSSINIISIGFLTNLADLLRSEPDDMSSLSGSDLVEAKARELVVMGGQYPSGWEFNFGGVDPASTAYVLENWPKNVSITYSGVELGREICSGKDLRSHSPPDSPVRAAYEWYLDRANATRESWDSITVLYGTLGFDYYVALGLVGPFAYANDDGYNSITSGDGSNAWIEDSNVKNRHWLELADGFANVSVASLLDLLYTQDAHSRSCFFYTPSLHIQ